ncbi:Integrase core domain-containing protein [Sinosporangium album]|uniref:Integrase core domain-containing protein n=1 Tax=Sinosporangium album TaxID=504805 RepID=A0A1G8DFR3_9ACTN|nr:Integrase core domain-containing protein [Sinosporangium album]
MADGVGRSTLYRNRTPRTEHRQPIRTAPPNALSREERDHLVSVLNSQEFRDKSVRQVRAALLDRGLYLASPSTMYRELRRRGQVRERRALARHEAKKKSQLIADRPNRVWSWDITRLRGPVRGQFLDLHVMLDIYSRYAVHWEVHTRESGLLARAFIENAIRGNGGIAPMRSIPVEALR